MNLCRTSCALAVALSFAVSSVAAAEAETRIVVPEIDDDAEATWRKLTWDDFRKDMDSWRREAAGIASQVVIGRARFETEPQAEGQGVVTTIAAIEAYAVMSKLESGFKPGGRSDWTLAHEQGHFDIAEVCARRLRSRLGDLRGKGATEFAAQTALEAELQKLYGETVNQCSALQAQYDGETGHGLNKKKQKQWWSTIEQWLEEHSDGVD